MYRVRHTEGNQGTVPLTVASELDQLAGVCAAQFLFAVVVLFVLI